MNWKFWKRQEPTWEIDTTEVPTSTLYRWFLYDSGIDEPNKYAEAAGLTPTSAEGDEMERRESLERLLQVLPYKSFIEMMSSINGKILAQSLTQILKDNDILSSEYDLESDLETMEEIYTRVSASALIPAIAAALQLGILVNPGTFVSGDIYE